MHSGILCADIGTSSLKAAVIAPDGTVLHFVRKLFPQPVRAVDWVSAFFSAWRTLTVDCAVQAICISGNGPSLIAVPQHTGGISTIQHKRGNICGSHTDAANPGVPAADTIDALIAAAERDTLFLWNEPLPSNCAIPASTSLFLPRIAAFHATHPQVFDNAAYIFSGPEYLAYLLTGTAATVLPNPRYEAAYWNTQELAHFAETALHIEAETLAARLPPFTAAGSILGNCCGIPVIAGVPDFIAALIGTATLVSGAACDRAGSSEGINICIPQLRRSAGALLLPSIIPDLWNISSVIPSSGAAFSVFLMSHGFPGNDYRAAMERIAAEPFIMSGAYPNTFAGQGRAFVERLAFRIRRGCDMLEQASGCQPVYTLSGGQAHNPCWCQMKADMTGRTFALPHFADAELLGDAALALFGLGMSKDLPAAVGQLLRIERYYEPDTAALARYTEKYAAVETAAHQ